jgi:hypothetical protein
MVSGRGSQLVAGVIEDMLSYALVLAGTDTAIRSAA